jgi:hypothetical protein
MENNCSARNPRMQFQNKYSEGRRKNERQNKEEDSQENSIVMKKEGLAEGVMRINGKETNNPVLQDWNFQDLQVKILIPGFLRQTRSLNIIKLQFGTEFPLLHFT